MRLRTSVLTLAVGLVMGGCSWVQLTEAGQDVQIGYSGDVQHCQRLGIVSVSTPNKVIVERGESTVQGELYTLARNRAAKMGATNLILHGLPEDGEQDFWAYNCPQFSDPIAANY